MGLSYGSYGNRDSFEQEETEGTERKYSHYPPQFTLSALQSGKILFFLAKFFPN